MGGTFFAAVLATPAMATVAQGTHAHIAVRKWVRTQSLFVRYKALLIYVSKWLWPTHPMNCETRYVNDLSKMRNCFNRMTKFSLQASRKSSIELLMRMAFLPSNSWNQYSRKVDNPLMFKISLISQNRKDCLFD